MRAAHIVTVLCLVTSIQAHAQGADATTRVQALLESVGGKEKWADARTLYVKEHAFLKSGETAVVEVWRDFEKLTRHLRVTSPSRKYVEVLGEESGWAEDDGRVKPLTGPEFEEQRQGLRQEPYSIYHRLAKGDPRLTVRPEGADRLNVYENDRLLCWFVLDRKNRPISWGNHFAGAVNQHWYGPLVPIGPVLLPKWGSASDGRWRFEYVDASLGKKPLELPARPDA